MHALFVRQALVCPDTGQPVAADGACSAPARRYARNDGYWPMLPAGGASNGDVQAFYEEQPFPDYEDLDSPRHLRERAAKSQFARLLDEQLPLDGLVLEAGCGTGQLSSFLALSRRPMVGLDFCAHSLRLACAFRDRFAIDCAEFVQGDIFQAPFRREVFDVVISLGVLHHTRDPQGAFTALVSHLRPGGHFVLGLYNRYGRLPTKMRGLAIRALGFGLGRVLDPVVRRDRHGARRQRSWLRDQYMHPLEKTHTVDEVLHWFAAAGLDFVNAVPKFVLGETFAPDEQLFTSGITGSRLGRILSQCGWALSHGWEGGLFVMLGRKR